jgi:hypothetical protein
MPGENTGLVGILASAAASLSVIASVLSVSYFKTRKQLTDLRGQESDTKKQVATNEIETSGLQMLLRSAQQWEEQYNKSIARETRYRRLLAVSEAKMRRQIIQAAEDRQQDRLKIEALVALLAEKDRTIVKLEAEIGGRRQADKA